jgi:hypothetical protein
LARTEQYEIWALNGEKWELTSAFRDFDVASAVARSRTTRVRLMHVIYEDSQVIEKQVIAEIGATREHP